MCEAKNLLKKLFTLNREPCAAEFIKVRNYYLTYLIFDNCTMPAGIYNMEISEFKKGKESSGGYIVQVIMTWTH